MRLRLGTSGSPLSLRQSSIVAEALRTLGHEVDLVTIASRGGRSRDTSTPPSRLGVLVADLRTSLLEGECDVVVHSLKNLPAKRTSGLVVAAIPVREDPRDALCARDDLRLRDLPPGARVGTGSPRRVAQLRAIRDDLDYIDVHGTIPIRLSRVAPGDLDAIVLAAAGLNWLGLEEHVTELLDILPSPGQGALAVECRSDDSAVREAVAALEDPDTRIAVTSERAVLRALGGGSAAPIGALGTAAQSVGSQTSTRTVGAGQPSAALSAGPSARELGAAKDEESDTPHLTAGVFALDGSRSLVLSVSVSTPEAAGQWMAQELVTRGAGEICDLTASRESRDDDLHDEFDDLPREEAPSNSDLRAGDGPLRSMSVFLPATEGALSAAIEAAGPTVICEPLTRWPASPDWEDGGRPSLEDGGEGGHVRAPSPDLWSRWNADEFDAVVVTDGPTAHAIEDQLGWPPRIRVLAVGHNTAAVLADMCVATTVAANEGDGGIVHALSVMLTQSQVDHRLE